MLVGGVGGRCGAGCGGGLGGAGGGGGRVGGVRSVQTKENLRVEELKNCVHYSG